MTEQRASDQAEIQQLRQIIAELQQAVTAYQSQIFSMQQMLPPRPSMPFSPAPAFSPAPGFTPGIDHSLPLGSMQMPNPLAQQWQTAPRPRMQQCHDYNAAFGHMSQAAEAPGAPARTSLASAQFGATNPAQVAESHSRLSAIERLCQARASLGGLSVKACPMQALLRPWKKAICSRR